jgi:hypothetical protein
MVEVRVVMIGLPLESKVVKGKVFVVAVMTKVVVEVKVVLDEITISCRYFSPRGTPTVSVESVAVRRNYPGIGGRNLRIFQTIRIK